RDPGPHSGRLSPSGSRPWRGGAAAREQDRAGRTATAGLCGGREETGREQGAGGTGEGPSALGPCRPSLGSDRQPADEQGKVRGTLRSRVPRAGPPEGGRGAGPAAAEGGEEP